MLRPGTWSFFSGGLLCSFSRRSGPPPQEEVLSYLGSAARVACPEWTQTFATKLNKSSKFGPVGTAGQPMEPGGSPAEWYYDDSNQPARSMQMRYCIPHPPLQCRLVVIVINWGLASWLFGEGKGRGGRQPLLLSPGRTGRRDEEGGWVQNRKIRDKENILCLGGDWQRVHSWREHSLAMPVLTTDAESETGIPKSLSNEPPSETMEEIEHTCPQPRLVSKDKGCKCMRGCCTKEFLMRPQPTRKKMHRGFSCKWEWGYRLILVGLFILSFSTRRCSQLTKHYWIGWVGNGLLGVGSVCLGRRGWPFSFRCVLIWR